METKPVINWDLLLSSITTFSPGQNRQKQEPNGNTTTREVHQLNLSQVQCSISVFEDIYEWSWWLYLGQFLWLYYQDNKVDINWAGEDHDISLVSGTQLTPLVSRYGPYQDNLSPAGRQSGTPSLHMSPRSESKSY